MFKTAEIESIHFSADDRLVDFIQNKVGQFNKIFNGIDNCKVILRQEHESRQQDKTVEITVNVPNKKLFAYDHAETFEIAADKVVNELKQQLRKYKEKLKDFNRVQIEEPEEEIF